MPSNKKIIRLSAFVFFAFYLNACGATFFGGSGSKTNSSPFRGGSDAKTSPTATPTPSVSQKNDGWPVGTDTRTDVTVDYGNDDQSLYVAANVYYNGDNSGSDALFKFYTQRVKPAPQSSMQQIISAQGDHKSDARVIPMYCRCGQRSEFYFFWEHKFGRKGALHSPAYESDNKIWGDWIVANTITGTGSKDWYSGNLKSAPQGPSSIFLGADTENPTAFGGTNTEGQGYLRTWYYHPNSTEMFSTTEHRWDSRDDMRIAISCEVKQCPAGTAAGTEISIAKHFSHDPSWVKP